ncbi:MAG: hypothetical protein AAGC97_17510 [Planctomycetota bacterium]
MSSVADVSDVGSYWGDPTSAKSATQRKTGREAMIETAFHWIASIQAAAIVAVGRVNNTTTLF